MQMEYNVLIYCGAETEYSFYDPQYTETFYRIIQMNEVAVFTRLNKIWKVQSVLEYTEFPHMFFAPLHCECS
jgi:hypothetical protein